MKICIRPEAGITKQDLSKIINAERIEESCSGLTLDLPDGDSGRTIRFQIEEIAGVQHVQWFS